MSADGEGAAKITGSSPDKPVVYGFGNDNMVIKGLEIIGGMDGIAFPPAPTNEPNLTYAPGTPERKTLLEELERLQRRQHSLRAVVNGRRRNGGSGMVEEFGGREEQGCAGVIELAEAFKSVKMNR